MLNYYAESLTHNTYNDSPCTPKLTQNVCSDNPYIDHY